MFTLIAQLIGRGGLAGVFGLMLLENLIPFIPSEFILPLAGFVASQGRFAPAAAVLAGTVGSAIGGLAWYWVVRRVGLERLLGLIDRAGRWAPVSRGELVRANERFRRWRWLAVCVGRAVPGVRGVICVPAGISRMPVWSFLVASTVGAGLWSTVLVSAGYALGRNYTVVDQWLNPITDGLVGLAVAAYAIRVALAPSPAPRKPAVGGSHSGS